MKIYEKIETLARKIKKSLHHYLSINGRFAEEHVMEAMKPMIQIFRLRRPTFGSLLLIGCVPCKVWFRNCLFGHGRNARECLWLVCIMANYDLCWCPYRATQTPLFDFIRDIEVSIYIAKQKRYKKGKLPGIELVTKQLQLTSLCSLMPSNCWIIIQRS